MKILNNVSSEKKNKLTTSLGTPCCLSCGHGTLGICVFNSVDCFLNLQSVHPKKEPGQSISSHEILTLIRMYFEICSSSSRTMNIIDSHQSLNWLNIRLSLASIITHSKFKNANSNCNLFKRNWYLQHVCLMMMMKMQNCHQLQNQWTIKFNNRCITQVNDTKTLGLGTGWDSEINYHQLQINW